MWWRVVTLGRVSEGGNWRMEWVASTLHTTSEHGVSSITTADAHNSAARSRLNWRPPPADLNGLVRFARKTKSGFCACAVTFQTQSTTKTVGKKTPFTSRGAPFAAFLFSEWNTPPSVGLVSLNFSLLFSTVKGRRKSVSFFQCLFLHEPFLLLKATMPTS